MSHSAKKRAPKMARPLAELVGESIDPLVRKRGLARAELLAWWPDIVGAAYAGRTAPDRIRWSRDGSAATLVVRCDPALALQFAHETEHVRERLNAYFGYPAVGAVRIVQRPVGAPDKDPPAPPQEVAISPEMEERLKPFDEPLRASLAALARGVIARS